MSTYCSLNGKWKIKKCEMGPKQYLSPSLASRKMDMNHSSIKEVKDWMDVTIPGSVYSAYLENGMMEDPFYRENELDAFDLLRDDFEFKKVFSVGSDVLDAAHKLLVCEGLDTIADVIVNGKALGHAENMHITWEWELGDLLTKGDNEIVIRFRSPIEAAMEADEVHPSWGSTDCTPGFMHIRKAHCMYGWDWGSRLPDAGIWRNIGIAAYDEAAIDSVLVLQEHEPGKVTLNIKPSLKFADVASDKLTVRAVVTSPDGQKYEQECLLSDISGESCGMILTIDNPKLWWPNGFGEQPLYTVNVAIVYDGMLCDSWERRIGLRTLTVSTEKDEYGEEFCHIVNGVKVFAMGGDYIPEDNVLARVTPERTRKLLEDAKAANFNSVRVWGGGYYPNDFFYDICDELGLMVWQDLMFACAYYYLTPEFDASIRLEAEQNLKRLRHHASLALISGNNEMEEEQLGGMLSSIQHEWMPGLSGEEGFMPHTRRHHADYIKMFEYILPQVAAEHAPQTFWWPSSPSSGGSFDDPQDPNRGDCHYWDVWHGLKPFTDYRKYFFRYASEFGFQSFPHIKTIESFTFPEDRNIFSRIMERHQRNSTANSRIISYMAQTFRYPSSFDNLVYCSQLLQAEAIRYGVEHWRRNRGRCMGAIIWQLNDNWPVASWASIDYYGRWKALHYYAKRFFAPIMISACEKGELDQKPSINEFYPENVEKSAVICVTNETTSDVSGTVKWKLVDPNGEVIKSGSEEVTVKALTAYNLEKLDFTDQAVCASALFYEFEVAGASVSYGSVIFCAPKHFAFADPKLSVSAEGEEIVVKSQAYAKSVYIESDDPDMLLADNFFDMLPGERRIKVIRGSAEGLRVRSVWDMDR